jgi:two-component system, LuxR family, response regulator FixJ
MATANRIVHVIEDDDAARDGLTFLLRAADFDVRAYESAIIFLESVSTLVQGCVVSDVRMPGIDGIEMLRRLRGKGIDWPVIVVTGHADIHLAVEAMREGAVDFLEKPYDDQVLLNGIARALTSHQQPAKRMEERAATRQRMSTLSPTERVVFDSLVDGRSNKTIAIELGIDETLIEIHRANVMAKMQATSLSDLMRMAFVGTRSESGQG